MSNLHPMDCSGIMEPELSAWPHSLLNVRKLYAFFSCFFFTFSEPFMNQMHVEWLGSESCYRYKIKVKEINTWMSGFTYTLACSTKWWGGLRMRSKFKKSWVTMVGAILFCCIIHFQEWLPPPSSCPQSLMTWTQPEVFHHFNGYMHVHSLSGKHILP